MATRNLIQFSTILKRSQSLNSINESTKIDSNKLYDNTMSLLGRSKTGREAGVQQALRSYIESMCNFQNASENYWQPLNLAAEFNKIDTVVSDKIIFEYNTRILPYVETPNNISNCIDNYDITESQKSAILEAVSMYNAADRIAKNHAMISKRFNMDKVTNKCRSVGLKYFIDSCADMISTYNVPNYQKMNITLEECMFLLEKNGIKYDKADIAKYTLEYFLTLNPSVSMNELNNYRRTLTESYVLSENDLSSIRYLFENVESASIESSINNYLINGDKNKESLSFAIRTMLDNTSKEDIVYNSDKILETMWDLYKNNSIEDADNAIKYCSNIIADYISEIAKLECVVLDKNFSKEDVTEIINRVNGISTMIKSVGNSDSSYSKEADAFIKNSINPTMESLTEVKELLYNSANLSAINYVNNESAEVVALDEFKLFKFHNLVRAAFNLDKFLKVKERKVLTKINNGLTKFRRKTKSLLWGESAEIESHMFDYIGEDCKADICIRQYQFNESELSSVIEFLETTCAEYNDVLLSQNETSRAYFIINPGLAEVRLKESTIVSIEDMSNVYNNLDPSIDLYLEMVIDADKTCDIYDNINTDSIESIISNISKCEKFTLEQFELALEAMCIIGVDSETVSVFGDKFNDYHFNYALDNGLINESYISLASQEREVANLVNSFTIEESIDWEDKIKALDYLENIFEYSYPSSDDEDDDEEDTTPSKPEVKKPKVGGEASANKKEDSKDNKKEEPKEKTVDDIKIPKPPKGGYKSNGLNLTSIKLGLNGIKSKYKELSTKEKEASRNIDNATRALVKSMKDALVSDRREAIIKGSVIPSFSRCIKAGILLAGVAHFSLPLALIAAVGSFALSKKLTKTERLLLLDEIETELEVVEKELALADSNNEIKKYRALLQYKKDLQRQYQRIRYNIRIGKDILPSTAGMVSREN